MSQKVAVHWAAMIAPSIQYNTIPHSNKRPHNSGKWMRGQQLLAKLWSLVAFSLKGDCLVKTGELRFLSNETILMYVKSHV